MVAGRLQLPIAQHYFDKVTQTFTPPAHTVHNGTDFARPVATPVVAPCDGKVYYRAIDHPSLGNAIYFRFKYGGSTYYARFLHFSVAGLLGAYKRGQLIGQTGNTGDSTGPYLHLDIRNRAIDSSVIRTKAGVSRYILDPLEFFSGIREGKGRGRICKYNN